MAHAKARELPETAASRPGARGAFTLVELMLVLGIIGLLVGLAVAVGRGVVTNTKRATTLDTIRILDTAMQAYIDATGSIPPPFVSVATPPAGQPAQVWPAFDGSVSFDASGNQRVLADSVGVFVAAAQRVPESKAVLDRLPTTSIRRYRPPLRDANGTIVTGANPWPELTTVVDAWGRPLRMVHPVFQGTLAGAAGDPATLSQEPFVAVAPTTFSLPGNSVLAVQAMRRNYVEQVAPASVTEIPDVDSDGGRVVNARPYFYSSGPDGEVGYRLREPGATANDQQSWLDYNADNIYLTLPTMPRHPKDLP